MKEKKKIIPQIHKGLDGIVADQTAISFVNVEKKSLYYRGYSVEELAKYLSFEEVAYLLIFEEIPSQKQLKEFKDLEVSERYLSEAITEMIIKMAASSHPMDILQTGISMMACESVNHEFGDVFCYRHFAVQLLAKIPLMIADYYRVKHQKRIVRPRKDLSITEHFFYACLNKMPNQKILRAFDQALVLYAEHSFNASTFTARMIISSQASFFGAISGAIASLKGPLHGGANEAVMHQFLEIGSLEDLPIWLDQKLEKKEKIMGFGHRVYKYGDSRVPTMRDSFLMVAAEKKNAVLPELYAALEEEMFIRKAIFPNLDYPAGPMYYLMGFDIDLFTPIFVMSRVAGWSAHIIEQAKDNRLIRPLSKYIGPQYRPL